MNTFEIMLLIVAIWAVCAPPAYLVGRCGWKKAVKSWTVGDRKVFMFLAAFFGPIALIALTGFLLELYFEQWSENESNKEPANW